MQVTLENVQSIVNGVYDFPDVGLVKISGGNSNGKSVLVKTINAITTLTITDQTKRRSLIRNGENQATITIKYKDKALWVRLTVERENCVVALIRANGEKVIRTFRDGGIKELLHEFGFRVYNRNDVCLQVFETFGPMPFVNRNPVDDGEIVEAVAEDAVAKEFLQKFKDITHKKAKEAIQQFDNKIAGWQRVQDSLVVYDYESYTSMADKMEKAANQIAHLTSMTVKPISVPATMNLVDVETISLDLPVPPPRIQLKRIPSVQVQPLKPYVDVPAVSGFDDLLDTLQKYGTVKAGECPTCGRPLFE